MASIRTDLGYGDVVDLGDLLAGILRGTPDGDKTSWSASLGDGTFRLDGSGFAYAANGQPTAGTVTGISQRRDGELAWEITGMRASAKAIADAARTTGRSDDIKALSNIFQGHDRFYGGRSDDTFHGFAGNDKLYGGKGDDTLSGGAGKDVLAGGLGYDTFVFDTELDAKDNVDVITDFSSRDTIQLDSAIFGEIPLGFMSTGTLQGVPGGGTAPCLIYNSRKGDLYFDADGTEAPVKFIHFANHDQITLQASDFFVV